MTELVVALAALSAIAVIVAWAFRRLGLRGDGIVAGLLVGVMLGPTVLGRIAPDTWETVVIGARAERAAVDSAISERQAFTMAASAAGQTADQVDAGLAERDEEISALAEQAARSVAAHARPWTIITTVLAVLAFWLGWAAARPARNAARDRGDPATMGALACWVALLPAFAAIVMFRLLGRPPTDPAVITTAACLAVAGWPAAGEDARRLDRLGLRDSSAATAAFATILAAMLALAARFFGSDAWAVAALPLMVFRFGPSPITIRARGQARRLLHRVVLPALAALAVCRSEVLIETPWIATIGILLIAGDGRAFGWLIGLRFAGLAAPAGDEVDDERPSIGWTTALTASGAAGSQLAFTAVAVGFGIIDTGIAFALVLAAAGIDFFSPSRRRLAVGL